MEVPAPAEPPVAATRFHLRSFVGRTLARTRGGPPTSRQVTPPPRHVPRRPGDWDRAERLDDDGQALYLHEYTATGMTIRGLVGALELGSTPPLHPPLRPALPDPVYPHEGVHERQVDELADRMERAHVNPAPILVVHRGRGVVGTLLRPMLAQDPLLAFSDQVGQQHRVWALRDPELLRLVDVELGVTRGLIADGHHRYAAYLRLRDRHPRTSWSAGLTMLVDHDETPLWLGPIHRHLSGRRLSELVATMSGWPGYRCEPAGRRLALERLGRRTCVLTDDRTWVAVHLPSDSSDLAVTTWEHDVLPRLQVPRSAMTHHHTVDSLLTETRASGGIAVLLPAPGFDDVLRASWDGHLLPEKTTSFQPKPSVGVLIRRLLDE